MNNKLTTSDEIIQIGFIRGGLQKL
jgi:hypothetical protein